MSIERGEIAPLVLTDKKWFSFDLTLQGLYGVLASHALSDVLSLDIN